MFFTPSITMLNRPAVAKAIAFLAGAVGVDTAHATTHAQQKTGSASSKWESFRESIGENLENWLWAIFHRSYEMPPCRTHKFTSTPV